MGKLNSKQRAAMIKHGYNPDVTASGIGGPPSEWRGAVETLRTRVRFLDGVEIDGHEMSDLDGYTGACIHCRGYDASDNSEDAIEWRAEQR